MYINNILVVVYKYNKTAHFIQNKELTRMWYLWKNIKHYLLLLVYLYLYT